MPAGMVVQALPQATPQQYTPGIYGVHLVKRGFLAQITGRVCGLVLRDKVSTPDRQGR